MDAFTAPVPTLVREVDPNALLLMPPTSGRLQPYLPRRVDSELDRALATPGFVLVLAESFAGARRSAYEALLRNLPDALLISHDAEYMTDNRAAVLWADFHEFEPGALDASIGRLQAWQTGPGDRWVLALTARAAIDAADQDRLTSMGLRLVHARMVLTEEERSTLPQHGLDSNLRTVSELYYASKKDSDSHDATKSGYFGSFVVQRDWLGKEPEAHSAGYHPDTDAGEDRLGITADVNMLADLVASRHVVPPLSIGLFGGWGSGKSFFMRQMRVRVRDLADATERAERDARRAGPAVSAYCSSIRQVTFNAWHYAESNLWASLATHLLGNLASSGSEDDLESHANDLAEQRRHQSSLLDQLSSVRVERMLLTAQLERESKEAPSPREIARTLAQILTEEDWATNATQLPRDTLDQVRAFADEATGLAAELRNFRRQLLRSRKTRIVIGLGVAATLLVLVLSRSAIWPSMIIGLTAAVSMIPTLSSVRASVRRIRLAADRLTDRAGESTRDRLAELDTEQTRLELAIADLTSTRDIAAFARSRDRSQDYRQHLGVVSLVRRDLEVFAAMLARDPHDADGTTGPERIVLYIDDLDRCPPDVVVKVLEAIHLLLAQPVFAIVVGADVDWLLHSLKEHYGPVIEGGASSSPDGARHYLEKIFQIPFTLAPMTADGFTRLIATLGQENPEGTAVPEHQAPTPSQPVSAARTSADSSPSGQTAANPPAVETPSPVLNGPQLRPNQLDITQAELDYIAGLAPLVHSPRGAKRLMNLYRLLRARLQGEQLTDFLNGHEPGYRAALILLTVMVGPSDTSALFRAIEAAPEHATWHSLLNDLPDLNIPGLQHLSSTEHVPSDINTYRSWLPLVRRFSFTNT
ncbi:P-loop NTPase fold protein [Glycomyces sp. NRRL B-16210]|uniref:P-loop NTPase fold protein n=1 Tax=Glycomyces sp. NRRL B-16210 TaxID=1463821 RepID=UPI0004BFA5F2|nr:P-loop NTPase fold protein [Glycomyces sp. NRRL B-16210]